MVPYGRPDELVVALRQALAAEDGVHLRARAHIAHTFPLHKREEALVRILTEAMVPGSFMTAPRTPKPSDE
jgi:hypothetical protein